MGDKTRKAVWPSDYTGSCTPQEVCTGSCCGRALGSLNMHGRSHLINLSALGEFSCLLNEDAVIVNRAQNDEDLDHVVAVIDQGIYGEVKKRPQS